MKTAETKSHSSNAPRAAEPFFQPEKDRDASFFGESRQEQSLLFQRKPAFESEDHSVQRKPDRRASSGAAFFTTSGDGGFFSKAGPPFFTPTRPQAKLTIGKPDNRYEQEADAVADQVVSQPEKTLATPPPVQRQEDDEQLMPKPLVDSITPLMQRQADEEAEAVQAKCAACEQEEHQHHESDGDIQTKSLLQKQSGGKQQGGSDLESRLSSTRGQGSPLDPSTRMRMESAFGADFGGVRVHTGTEAAGLSRDLGAKAFTHGNDIYFNEGKYSPGTREGEHLLAHELTHTVQQGASVRQSPEVQREEDEDLAKELEASDLDAKEAIDPAPAEQAREQADKEGEDAREAAEEQAPEPEAPPEDKKAEEAPPVAEPQRRPPEQVKPSSKETESKGEVGQNLDQESANVCSEGAAKAQELADNEQAHDEAGQKLEQTESAVVPPAEEGQSRSNADQVETVEAASAPQPDPEAARSTLDTAIEESVPSSIEAMNEFESKGKAKVVGSTVLAQASQEVGQVQGTYSEVEKAAPAPEPPASTPLPATEVAPETPALNLGEGAVPDLKDEHTDVSEFEQQSDALLEQENITQEQLDMVDSGDLAEANQERKDLKQKVNEQPAQVQAFAQQQQLQVKTDLKKEEQQGRAAMEQRRKQDLNATQEKQKKTKSEIELKREAVTKKINQIYEAAKKKVTTKLNNLETQSLQRFDRGQALASKQFEQEVKRDIRAWKRERYSGLFGGVKWIRDQLLGIDDFPEVKQAFERARERYVKRIDQLIKDISAANELVIEECKTDLAEADKQIKEYVAGLGPELQSTGQKALQDMEKKLAEMDSFVDKKKKELQQKLCDKKEEAIKAIDEKIEKMKEEMSGLVGKLGNLLLNAALKFFEWALEKAGFDPKELMGIINKGKAVLKKVITDPIGFIMNLVGAVKLGVDNFVANIKKHLISGLVSWLTGAMADVPIELPQTWDLKGILHLVLQILGLTWERIRAKLVERVGEKVVEGIETSVDIVKRLIAEGPIALWNMIKEKAAEIKQQVMDGIRDWVITNVVKQAVIKLLSFLNPAGAILQAIIAIYNAIMFFVENGDRIVTFVKTVFNSIGDIAMGKIGAAAAAVEKAMAQAIPIILNFLARLIGLSGIGKAVTNIIERIRKPVDNVVDKALDFIVGQAKGLVSKLTGKGTGQGGAFTEKDKKAAVKAIGVEEKKYVEQNTISQENAKKVAKTVAKEHPVFKSITVVDGGDRWNYQYIFKAEEVTPPRMEEGQVNEADVDRIIYRAMKLLGDAYYKGFSKEDIKSGKARTEGVTVTPGTAAAGGATTPGAAKTPERLEAEQLENARQGREAQIQAESSAIHQALAKAQIAYSTAAQATHYPNNTFRVNGGRFFVDQNNNYYLLPADRAEPVYTYMVGGHTVHFLLLNAIEQAIVRSRSPLEKFDRGKGQREAGLKKSKNYQQGVWKDADVDRMVAALYSDEKRAELEARVNQEIREIEAYRALATTPPKNILSQLKVMKAKQDAPRFTTLQTEGDLEAQVIITVRNPATVGNLQDPSNHNFSPDISDDYRYVDAPINTERAKELYADFPRNITSSSQEITVFVASVVIEPSRHTVSHISNMLVLGEKRETPGTEPDVAARNLGAYEEMSMTQRGSDPSGMTAQEYGKDPNLEPVYAGGDEKQPIQNVTDRDIAALKTHNPKLYNQLKTTYSDATDRNEEKMAAVFADKIARYLGLK